MRRYTARFQTCHKLSSLGAENDNPFPLKELVRLFIFVWQVPIASQFSCGISTETYDSIHGLRQYLLTNQSEARLSQHPPIARRNTSMERRRSMSTFRAPLSLDLSSLRSETGVAPSAAVSRSPHSEKPAASAHRAADEGIVEECLIKVCPMRAGACPLCYALPPVAL